MANAEYEISRFTIASVDATSVAIGSVTMERNPLLPNVSYGILAGIRVSVDGSSTDTELRLGDTAMASDRTEYSYKLSEINGALTDDSVFSWIDLTDDELYWRVKENSGLATGVITVKLLVDRNFLLRGSHTIS